MSEEYQEQPTEPARDEGGAEEFTEKESTEERKARRGKELVIPILFYQTKKYQ